MSEQELKDAKIAKLEAENIQLSQTLRILGGELRARRQACEEFLNINIQFRSTQILLEEDVQRLNKEAQMLKERCIDLQKKLDEFLLKQDNQEAA